MDQVIENLLLGISPSNRDDIAVSEAAKPDTSLIKTKIYPYIEKVLSTPSGDNKFKNMVGVYMDKNHNKLHTPGPQYMIGFTDKDKNDYFMLFDITPRQVTDVITDITRQITEKSKFLYLRQNPILVILWSCIRYYHIKKDTKGLNTALAIYALAVYPSVYSVFFKYPPNANVMKYTIDHMSEKFTIKRAGHIFGMLYMSINSSFYGTGGDKVGFTKSIIEGTDSDVIRFIQRIHNDQKSMVRNICDVYMKNYKEGLRSNQSLDSALSKNDMASIDTGHENNSTVVDSVVQRVTIPIITNGPNLQIISEAKDLAGISLADCRYYIAKILIDKNSKDIENFVHSILFRYLYDDKHYPQDINSKGYLVWCSQLFRQTNSKNDNIRTIKELLDKWAEETGIHAKFKREASRINYKKAIFYYFALSIQYYNNK